MINHLRTLILNQTSSEGTPFDQFIPDEFRGAILNADELRVRNLMFDPASPRDYQEFAATCLARIVYGTDLAEKYINPIDDRTTIDWDFSLVPALSQTLTLEKLVGTSLVDVFGIYTPDVSSGIFSNSWTVTAISSVLATVDDERLQSNRQVVLTFTNGLSNEIRLETRSGLWLRFTNLPALFPVIVKLSASSPPSYDVYQLMTRFRQEERVRAFIASLDIPDLLETYDNRLYPVRTVAAAICAYCISVSRRISG